MLYRRTHMATMGVKELYTYQICKNGPSIASSAVSFVSSRPVSSKYSHKLERHAPVGNESPY